jgi:hypothetical protein
MKTLLIAGTTVVLLAADLAPEPLRREIGRRDAALKTLCIVGDQQNFVGKEHPSRMIG